MSAHLTAKNIINRNNNMENEIKEILINSFGFLIIWIMIDYKRKEKLSTSEIIIIGAAMVLAGLLIQIEI
jgi:hypothetical protein